MVQLSNGRTVRDEHFEGNSEDRIPIWNVIEKRSIVGTACPKRKNLRRYLEDNQDFIVYEGRQVGRDRELRDYPRRMTEEEVLGRLQPWERVTIWDKHSGKKTSGRSAVMQRELQAYLDRNPHKAIYVGQDLFGVPGDRTMGPEAQRAADQNERVDIWNPEEGRRVSGNGRPARKNLPKYFRKHPTHMLYDGQDLLGHPQPNSPSIPLRGTTGEIEAVNNSEGGGGEGGGEVPPESPAEGDRGGGEVSPESPAGEGAQDSDVVQDHGTRSSTPQLHLPLSIDDVPKSELLHPAIPPFDPSSELDPRKAWFKYIEKHTGFANAESYLQSVDWENDPCDQPTPKAALGNPEKPAEDEQGQAKQSEGAHRFGTDVEGPNQREDGDLNGASGGGSKDSPEAAERPLIDRTQNPLARISMSGSSAHGSPSGAQKQPDNAQEAKQTDPSNDSDSEHVRPPFSFSDDNDFLDRVEKYL